MLGEFFDKHTIKILDLFIANPAEPMGMAQLTKGHFGPKVNTETIMKCLQRFEDNDMILRINPGDDTPLFVCNIKSKIIMSLMSIDIDLLTKDLEAKRKIRAKSYTYTKELVQSAFPQEQKSDPPTETPAEPPKV